MLPLNMPMSQEGSTREVMQALATSLEPYGTQTNTNVLYDNTGVHDRRAM